MDFRMRDLPITEVDLPARQRDGVAFIASIRVCCDDQRPKLRLFGKHIVCVCEVCGATEQFELADRSSSSPGDM